jgi:undecaprenyl-diphosphatase
MDASIFKIIILAAVQGIAEFLPISSSGHLVVIGKLLEFNPEASVQMNIVLHAGTLSAIIIYYFKELLNLLKPTGYKLLLPLFIGTLPVAIVGVLIKKTGLDDILFNNLFIPGIGFLITATLLWWGLRKGTDATPLEKISLKQALLVGIAQSIAIMPGISRSGSTISAGLKLGLKKADAARFSFLLAIPAIGGASLVEILSALKKQENVINSSQGIPLLIGFVVSAVIGYAALRLLLKLLQKGRLDIFAWYLYLAGASVLIWATVLIFI